MQALTMLTDLQQKFLIQMNSYHRSISNDHDGKYNLASITSLEIDYKHQDIIVIYNNVAIFRYRNTGAVIKIK